MVIYIEYLQLVNKCGLGYKNKNSGIDLPGGEEGEVLHKIIFFLKGDG